MLNESQLVSVGMLMAREPLFAGLNRDQIRSIAERFELLHFEKDQVIIREGDDRGDFFLVFNGNVRLSQGNEEEEDAGHTAILSPGEFFGQEALLLDQLQAVTAVANQPVDLLHWSEEVFDQVLDEFPQIEERLLATAKSQTVGMKEILPWLQEDEIVLLSIRKHVFFLFTALLLPGTLVLLSLAGLAFAVASGISWLLFLTAFGATIGLIWAVWNGVDWGNDYYILTNRRVMWLEKIVGLYQSRTEAPLSAILSTDIFRDYLGQLFHFGDVTVRTYMGTITMKHADHPTRMTTFIDSYRNRAVHLTRQSQTQEIEKAVEDALKQRLKPAEFEDIEVKQVSKPPEKPETQVLPKDYVTITRSLFKMRFEEDGTITYRKHWYILIGKVWWQIVLLLVLLPSVIGAGFIGPLGWMFSCGLSALFFLVLGVFVYRAWDWHNDIFRLTPTQILDIEKKPLGAESKKTANLDAPDLRIEHIRPSFLANVLNFGIVTVYIGQTPFNLEGVYDPDQVHQEIASKREALVYKKRQDEESRERDRMLQYLVALYVESEKLKNSEEP